ncbi:MAG: hypothetical protein HHJ12_12900 [Glaciimonas sp.]|nr:hypothetical protein [Glaciimonas sp.]
MPKLSSVQLGLLATEVSGYADGVITKLSGVMPNSVLHLLLAVGFAYFWINGGKAPGQNDPSGINPNSGK